ncbi:MAG: N-acetylmuramoyl-L-alanine amidase [Nitrosomonas sp.]|nr:N-acetylmuramoyl-L-alanine amidase [Nitrosomonas sp.]
MNTRQITGIIIHCSGTPDGKWFSTQDIDHWHRERGFKRDEASRQRFNSGLHAIGYHYVIYTNGAIATGRSEAEIGAHAQGFNSKSIGICLIGTDKFSLAQWDSLRDLVCILRRDSKYPNARITGHRNLPDVHKTCPGFSVSDWLADDMQPLSGHLFEAES